MKTKLVSLFVALFTATALWAYPFQHGDLYYNILNSTTVEVTYYQYGYNSNVTSIIVPDTIIHNGTTYSVVQIGGWAFSTYPNLNSVSIGNNVRKIGFFGSCNNLTSVTIGNNVKEIEDDAFSGCGKLNSIVWNAKNYSGYNEKTPFYSISSQIRYFSFGDSVEYIPYSLCEDMSRLTKITIPNSVVEIENSAFSGCLLLSSVIIGDSVKIIGDDAFANCSRITSIVIPKGVRYLSGFSGTGITTLSIPESVTNIGENAFSGCNLSNITIPDSVRYIGRHAFAETNITSITIPENVTTIGHEAFECFSLDSVIWNPIECQFIDGDVTNADGVFSSGVTSFTFGDKVKTIPWYLCYNLSALTEIVIPSNVDSIGKRVFTGCNSLGSIKVDSENRVYDSRNDCNAIIRTKDNALIAGGPSTIIPQDVTSIEYYAFEECKTLSSITIPNGITSIGGAAFCGCMGLTSVTIPNSVTSIGGAAFGGCMGLTSVTIPNSVTSIGDRAFYNCNNLSSATISEGVESIGKEAFYDCTKLRSITIPETMSFIGEGAFRDCDSLRSVIWNARNCSCGRSSSSGTIFYGYEETNINVFTFGRNVETIPSFLLAGLHQPTVITVKADIPPIVGGSGLGLSTYSSSITIYIPCGTTDIYNAVSDWSKYKQYFKEAPNNTLEVSVSDNEMGKASITKHHTCNSDEAQITATPYANYHFTQWSDGNTDNPRIVIVTSDTCFIAEFERDIPQYYVRIDYIGGGSATGEGLYYEGDTATLTAVAAEGYEFKQWWMPNNDEPILDNPYTFVVTQDINFTVEFVPVSAVDNITSDADVTTRKLFHDGKLFIIRGRRMYDALGNEITDKD